MAQGATFRPQGSDGLGVGAVLALLAHVLLVAALAFGVSWKTSDPAVVEAEVWSEVPRAAAPEAPPPMEVAPPRPVEPVEPPPQVTPEPEPIAELARQPEPKRKPKPKPTPKLKEKPLPPVVKVEPKPKPPKPNKVQAPVVTPVIPPPPKAVSSAEREAQRRANLDRMMNDLGGQGGLGSSARSAGPSGNYGGKLRSRIIPNIVFTGTLNGNPTAFVEIRCAPDGRILSRRLLDSSGSPEWDNAVLRGIDKTEFIPLDDNGRLPDTVLQIGISPKDR